MVELEILDQRGILDNKELQEILAITDNQEMLDLQVLEDQQVMVVEEANTQLHKVQVQVQVLLEEEDLLEEDRDNLLKVAVVVLQAQVVELVELEDTLFFPTAPVAVAAEEAEDSVTLDQMVPLVLEETQETLVQQELMEILEVVDLQTQETLDKQQHLQILREL